MTLRLRSKHSHFSPRPARPLRGLARPRLPPIAARQLGGRPRPPGKRLRGQAPDKEARYARAPVLKQYVPPTAKTSTTTTEPTTALETTTTTTTVRFENEQLPFGGNIESELQWYPMKEEKVIELNSYKQFSLPPSAQEIMQDPEHFKSLERDNKLSYVSPENIIDLTGGIKLLMYLFHSANFIDLQVTHLSITNFQNMTFT